MASLITLIAQGEGGGGGNVTFLVSLVLLVGIFYFLLIRPQQKRMRAQRDLLGALAVGDEVITIGGIYGRIVEMDDDSVTVDVAPGTKLRFVKNAIARRLVDETAPEEEAGGGS